MSRLTSDRFAAALVEAGILYADDPLRIRRIVIDAQAGHVVVMHVEYLGDTRLLDVVRGLDGIEVRETPADRPELLLQSPPELPEGMVAELRQRIATQDRQNGAGR